MLYHRKTRSKKVQMQARAVAVWGQHRALPFSSAQETVGPKKREASLVLKSQYELLEN